MIIVIILLIAISLVKKRRKQEKTKERSVVEQVEQAPEENIKTDDELDRMRDKLDKL